MWGEEGAHETVELVQDLHETEITPSCLWRELRGYRGAAYLFEVRRRDAERPNWSQKVGGGH